MQKKKLNKVLDPELVKLIRGKNRMKNRGNGIADVLDLSSAHDKHGVKKRDILDGMSTAKDSLISYLDADEESYERKQEANEKWLETKRKNLDKLSKIKDIDKRIQFRKKHGIEAIDISAHASRKKREELEDIYFMENENKTKEESGREIWGNDDPNHYLNDDDVKDKLIPSRVKSTDNAGLNLLADMVGVQRETVEDGVDAVEDDDDAIARESNTEWDDPWEEI